MVVARGKETYLTRLERKHVDYMQLWGSHSDPLLRSYNFHFMNHVERDYWYSSKVHSFVKRCYAVHNLDHQLVGYIALRNIQWFRRISELGIVFDPRTLGKGYGTDSLKSFLNYYFEEIKMNELNLKVAGFNIRAQKCYRNSGFQFKEKKYDEFEDQGLPVFEDEKLREFKHYFVKEGNILKCQFIYMYITRQMYFNNK
jgi:diamine N-acetyltransferase